MDFWDDVAPLAGNSTVRCYPNYTLPGGAMYIFGDGLSQRVQTYLALRTYEADGVTPINPTTYLGLDRTRDVVTGNYSTYGEILGVGADAFVTRIVRHDMSSGATTVVRGSAGAPVIRSKFIVVDPEAPLEQKFWYEVFTDGGGVYKTSPCQAVYEVKSPTGPHCVPVLVSDPVHIGAMEWLDLLSIDPLSYSARTELKDVISRHAPVALSGVRSTARTTFHFLTRTLAEREIFLSIIMTGRILLYRNPNAGYPENNWYISVGDVTENRIHPDHARPERKWDVEVAVVDRPEGLLVPADDRIYADVRDFEPDGRTPIDPATYTGVLSDYGDYLTVLLGGRGGGSSVGQGTAMDNLVYGGGRMPTRQAARTSWSLAP